MTDDIVEQLRGAVRRQSGGRFWQTYFSNAADEIERLRADNEYLRGLIGENDIDSGALAEIEAARRDVESGDFLSAEELMRSRGRPEEGGADDV